MVQGHTEELMDWLHWAMWQGCPRKCARNVRYIFYAFMMRWVLTILYAGILLCAHVAIGWNPLIRSG